METPQLPEGIQSRDLALFRAARQEKTLSDASLRALAKVGYDSRSRSTHPPAADYDRDQVNLTSFIGDDSGSMANPPRVAPSAGRFEGIQIASKAQILELAQNGWIDALSAFQNADTFRMQTALLHEGILVNEEGLSYLSLPHAIRLVRGVNLNPRGGSPIIRRTMETLGRAFEEGQEFRNNYVNDVRIYLMMAHDGGATDHDVRAEDVQPLIADARASHYLKFFFVGMAMDNSEACIQSYLDMGLLDEEIIRPGDNATKVIKSIEGSAQAIERVSNLAKRQVLALPAGEIAALARQNMGK